MILKGTDVGNGMKIAVLMGGKSFEREFSLASGKQICAALEEAGHKVVPLDTTEALVPTLRSERPDVAFICMHGAGGEDGTVPALLEFLRIPYVGSRAPVWWKRFMSARGIRSGRAISSRRSGAPRIIASSMPKRS